MTIRWETLEPAQYEDMVSVLLSNMHADSAQRIDGSGGDGGRDVQLVDSEGVDGYELKSFTGRMKGAKREQVKRSIRRAAALGLRSWTLVVPIDPTPKELEWFEGLSPILPCEMRWLGRTWLDSQLAERPFVANYFVRGAADEVVAILRELGHEEAALANGVPDAAARAQRIARRANDLDPHYRFKIDTDGQETRITVIPRYPGAERDRPIEVKTNFTFPMETPEGQTAYGEFEEHMKFGTPVRISGDFIEKIAVDAPAGLGGEWTGGTIEMSSIVPADSDRELALAVKDGDGVYLAQVTLALKIKHRGKAGGVLEGSDRSGSLKVRLRVDEEARNTQATLTILGGQAYVPHEMLPLARLIESLRDHDELALLAPDGRELGSVSGGFVGAEEWATEGFASLVEDLALVQVKAGRVAVIKPELSLNDARNAKAGAMWARGEAVEGTWTELSITLGDVPEDTRREIQAGGSALHLESPGPALVVVQGVTYRFGTSTLHHFPSARLSDLCGRRYSKRLPPRGAKVTFVPDQTDEFTTSVV